LNREADSHSAGQSTSPSFMVHYCVSKNQPSNNILCQLNPVHDFKLYLLRFILILFSHIRLGLISGLFRPSLPTKIVYTFHMSKPRPLFELIILQ